MEVKKLFGLMFCMIFLIGMVSAFEIDNVKDYWPSGMSNRHYYILDRDIASSKRLELDGKFDLITCVSVLEHIIDHKMALQNMFGLLNEGGHLIITCPYTENNYTENDSIKRKVPQTAEDQMNYKIAEFVISENVNNYQSKLVA